MLALRHAARELLPVDLPVALDRGDEPFRERVHDRDADAVEAAGDLVALAAELAAGVELRQHDRRAPGRPVPSIDVDRDAAAVVDDGDRVVGMDRDLDRVVEAGHRLVDGVVDDLVDEVVQAARAGRADVHAGPQADRLEALEDGDVLGGVRRVWRRLGHKLLRQWAESEKCLQNTGFAGCDTVYQSGRSDRLLARLSPAAFSTVLRSFSSPIAAAIPAASRSSLRRRLDGRRAGAGADRLAASGPGANLTAGTPSRVGDLRRRGARARRPTPSPPC